MRLVHPFRPSTYYSVDANVTLNCDGCKRLISMYDPQTYIDADTLQDYYCQHCYDQMSADPYIARIRQQQMTDEANGDAPWQRDIAGSTTIDDSNE